jgi:hypothetical protein
MVSAINRDGSRLLLLALKGLSLFQLKRSFNAAHIMPDYMSNTNMGHVKTT